MENPLRIPFAVAIEEPRLLKPRFDELSMPQQVALKALYGCPLSTTKVDRWGLSELDHWSFMQEGGRFDRLGFPIGKPTPIHYPARAYREGWIVAGIRGGKTDCYAATIIAYEATCGGHEAFIRPGRQAVCFEIAQDLRLARFNLHGIRATLESMPFITQPLRDGKSRISNVTADAIELWNGMRIMTIPPTVKSIRGYDAPAAVLDEVGVWYQDAESANPDYEIYRAVSSRQAQFSDPMIVGISSPWNKGGMLYQRYEAGTDGRKLFCHRCRLQPVENCPACARLRSPHQGRIILFGTTASFDNPLISRKWLEEEVAKDPKAFERECLARFQDSLSGFLDTALLKEAIERGIGERPPDPQYVYVAAIDPAFRRDAFGFAIGHADPKRGIVLDVIRRWKPQPGAPPLNPSTLLSEEVVPLLKSYKVITVHSDQHHFDSLNQLAMQNGFVLEAVPFTAQSKADIYGNLKQLLNQRRLVLLDNSDLENELSSLELKLSEAGGVQIGAPRGMNDDLAAVAALVCHKSIWMLPPPIKEEEKDLPLTTQIFNKVQARRIDQQRMMEAYD